MFYMNLKMQIKTHSLKPKHLPKTPVTIQLTSTQSLVFYKVILLGKEIINKLDLGLQCCFFF